MDASVKCPICDKTVSLNSPGMPFCSDRCRLIDLGNWASEKYTIPGQHSDELEEVEEQSKPPQGRSH